MTKQMVRLPFHFVRDLYRNRELLYILTKRDMQNRYLGSFLGMMWTFIQPLVTIMVIWFVFQFGFKVKATSNGVPFALWLISGMIPWFFFAEALSSSTNSIVEQAQIVKKVAFRISLLPLVKINAALVIHIFFVILLASISFAYGFQPNLHWLQLPYYLLASLYLLLGLSWLTSAIVIFFRDMGQVIGIVIQLGFWITPIFWNVTTLSPRLQTLFKLNPAFYLIQGYRNSFCSNVWFWQTWKWGMYFWGVSSLIFMIGITVFKKLKPHFTDVL